MKRGIVLTAIVIAAIVGFLAVRGTMPFMPIFGASMEPTLQSGNLLMIEPVDPKEVEVGDIIVYNVPSMIRDYYNYPPVIAHRVTKVNAEPRLAFRTAGDNTGEDPFTIMPSYLRGTVGNQIPYLGLPLLFLQSQQGIIFTAIALVLLAIFLYGEEMSQGGRILQRGIFTPVIQESRRTNRVLVNKIETTEQRMNSTQQALEKFSAAIAEYAQHLASHTSAIQGLSEASQELKKSAANQNQVLAQLMVSMQPREPQPAEVTPGPEPATPEREKAAPKAAKKKYPPGCVRSRQKPTQEDNFRSAHPKNQV